MSTFLNLIKPVVVMSKTITAGDALRRTHYTQVMGGSQWKTLTRHMVEAQDGVCALCGEDDLKRMRIDNPKALTLHLLIPSSQWSTDTAKRSTTANNGKSLDPYRFGFVPSNVVVAHTACSQMVSDEHATASTLAIKPSQVLTVWTAEMKRASKVVAPKSREELRRTLRARGWGANN